MSHSVVITRTTTTTSGSGGFMVNSGYIKTFPGLLKLAQLVSDSILLQLTGKLSCFSDFYLDFECRLRWTCCLLF